MNEGDFRKKRKRGKKGENQFYNFYLKKKKMEKKNRKKNKPQKNQPFCTKLERKREGEGPSSGSCLLKNFTNRLLKVIFIQ